jgi:hypothetical protein
MWARSAAVMAEEEREEEGEEGEDAEATTATEATTTAIEACPCRRRRRSNSAATAFDPSSLAGTRGRVRDALGLEGQARGLEGTATRWNCIVD